MAKSMLPLTLCAVLALGLAGCGRSTGDRALSGAAIGAGVGAGAAAITGGSVGAGALIGGAVGGVAGAATKQRDVDLGKPAWRDCDRDANGYTRC